MQELADAAQLSSLADETPKGRSVVVLAKETFGIRGRNLQDKNMTFIPFTALTRMSGVNYDGNEIRKGAADAIQSYVTHAGAFIPMIANLLSRQFLHRAAHRWWYQKTEKSSA